jgi:hydrogenase-4 membrane subunit HyfE
MVQTMQIFHDPLFGNQVVTLLAAVVLVLQIAMVGQRWIVMNIRIFAAQSFLLAMMAGTIAWFNSAVHIYIAAALTLAVKAILVPILLERLVERIEIQHEIEPIINVPVSVVISGALTLIAYIIAEAFNPRSSGLGGRSGHNVLAVAISVFWFSMMINRVQSHRFWRSCRWRTVSSSWPSPHLNADRRARSSL